MKRNSRIPGLLRVLLHRLLGKGFARAWLASMKAAIDKGSDIPLFLVVNAETITNVHYNSNFGVVSIMHTCASKAGLQGYVEQVKNEHPVYQVDAENTEPCSDHIVI